MFQSYNDDGLSFSKYERGDILYKIVINFTI